MAETGILDPEERVELIEGQIIPMTPKKPPHSAVTKQALLTSGLKSQYIKAL